MLLETGLTRHKISDRWRERASLRVECGSHSKVGTRRGPRFAEGMWFMNSTRGETGRFC